MSQPFVFNDTNALKLKKTALLSYLVDPVVQEKEGVSTTQFSNNGAARSWARVLRKAGYEVHVINWDNTKPKLTTKYDLVVAHGGKNASVLMQVVKPEGKLLYYSTGSYWRYHNEQESKRFKEFTKRTKHSLQHDRYIGDEEEAINKRADAIISLGNKATANTYASFNNVYSIEAAGYPSPVRIPRIVSATSKNFLFLAGPGNIHKGLDLIIEAFRIVPELHLHIVTTLNDDFAEYYKDSLFGLPNIHTYGYVPQRSPLYYAIVRQCSFSILMSCSEGSPGSVIEAIQQGLFSIVSDASHIDPKRAGQVIKDPTVKTIQQTIKELANKSVPEIEKIHKETYRASQDRFSVQAFEDKLLKVVQNAVEAKS